MSISNSNVRIEKLQQCLVDELKSMGEDVDTLTYEICEYMVEAVGATLQESVDGGDDSACEQSIKELLVSFLPGLEALNDTNMQSLVRRVRAITSSVAASECKMATKQFAPNTVGLFEAAVDEAEPTSLSSGATPIPYTQQQNDDFTFLAEMFSQVDEAVLRYVFDCKFARIRQDSAQYLFEHVYDENGMEELCMAMHVHARQQERAKEKEQATHTHTHSVSVKMKQTNDHRHTLPRL